MREVALMAVKECKQVPAIVVDADTVRIGGIAFVRERTCRAYSHGCLVIGGTKTFLRCWSCSECHYGWHVSDNDKPYSHCPNCGAKVAEHD